jgi:hypothetical protein
MQQEEIVHQIPYTVQRPVTQQMVQKYQVQVCNWQPQEMVRRVPITTCRMEYEERVEQVPVRTCKWVTETSTVMREHCVAKWVPVTCTRLVPRTVMMTGAGDCCGVSTVHYPAATAYDAPGAGQPAVSPSTSLKKEPEESGTTETPNTQSQEGGKSVLKTPDLNGPDAPPASQTQDEPADETPQLPHDPPPSTEETQPQRSTPPVTRPPYPGGPRRLNNEA